MNFPTIVYKSIKENGFYPLELKSGEIINLVEEDVIFESDELWFMPDEEKARGCQFVRRDGKNVNEPIIYK